MATYRSKRIYRQLSEVIWDGIYLSKTLDVNEVIEDLVSHLSVEKAKQILYIYSRGALAITNGAEC